MTNLYIALLTFGVILFLVGIIGQVKAKEIEVGTNNRFARFYSWYDWIVIYWPFPLPVFCAGAESANNQTDFSSSHC